MNEEGPGYLMNCNRQFELPDVTRILNQPQFPANVTSKPLRANSRLERVLRSGRFAVTAEIHAPDSVDPAVSTRTLWSCLKCAAVSMRQMVQVPIVT